MKNTKQNFQKIVLGIVLILSSNTFFAQTVFDKFDGQEEVTSIIVNKKLFSMMANVKMDVTDKEAQQYLNLIKKLDNLKIFKTESKATTTDMRLTADKYVKTAGLEELMRVNDANQNIKIYVKSGSKESQVKELLLFMDNSGKNNQTVLMSLTGDFELDEISALTNKMNLPGGDALKKATKNK